MNAYSKSMLHLRLEVLIVGAALVCAGCKILSPSQAQKVPYVEQKNTDVNPELAVPAVVTGTLLAWWFSIICH
jgi:hypothetical protein